MLTSVEYQDRRWRRSYCMERHMHTTNKNIKNKILLLRSNKLTIIWVTIIYCLTCYNKILSCDINGLWITEKFMSIEQWIDIDQEED